jgi:large subunit ribosomal protein L10Ae
MSKINPEFLKKAITDMITERKKRKFVETVELQVGLRDYDPEKRFTGAVKLPNHVVTSVKVISFSNIGLCSC